MNLWLLVTLLATASLPQGASDLPQAPPAAAPDSLGGFGSLGGPGPQSPPGKDFFAGFS